MIIQADPVNTMDYMIAGYAVIFGVMLVYVISIWVRGRNLAKDLAELEKMEKNK